MDAYVYLVIALVFGAGICIGYVLGRVDRDNKRAEAKAAKPYVVDAFPTQFYGGRPMPHAPTPTDFVHDPFFAHDGEDENGVERRVAKTFVHI